MCIRDRQYNLKEHSQDLSVRELKILAAELESYKKQYNLIDFNDMITEFVKSDASPKFDVVFIDEAQDLSLMQWDMAKSIWNKTEDTFIAGDDDQAIFKWAGADVDSFINWEAREILLDKSERVPQLIQRKALDVISRIYINRISKNYLPKNDFGNIHERFAINKIDLSTGDWLILARTNSLLKKIPAYLKEIPISSPGSRRI